MSETPNNPMDPRFLASRSLDERLGESEQQCLEEALRTDKTLAGESQAWRTVDQLLKNWGREAVELDWGRFEAAVQAQVCEATEERLAELTSVDRVLSRWAQDSPKYDEKALSASVMREVRQTQAVPFGRSRIMRYGGRFALAASFLLVLTVSMWMGLVERPVSLVQFASLTTGNLESTRMIEVNVVVFDRTLSVDGAECAEQSNVAYLSVGSGPVEETWEEVPPL